MRQASASHSFQPNGYTDCYFYYRPNGRLTKEGQWRAGRHSFIRATDALCLTKEQRGQKRK